MIASAKTLQDITDDRVVPMDFLGVLLVLFFFMVVDRLFYTLGLHVGKVRPNCPLSFSPHTEKAPSSTRFLAKVRSVTWVRTAVIFADGQMVRGTENLSSRAMPLGVECHLVVMSASRNES